MTVPSDSQKPIYLTGFMAAGKSSVGRLLAKELGRSFFDLDDRVSDWVGITIPEIFIKYGEAFFREQESALLGKIELTEPESVVACGGGVILSEQNRNLLSQGIWCFLDVPFSILEQRLKIDSNQRPLNRGDANDLRKLYEQRLPLYRLAPVQILCDSDSPQMVVARLCQQLLLLGV